MPSDSLLRHALFVLTVGTLLVGLGSQDAHAGWSLKKARRSIKKRIDKTHARVVKHTKQTTRSVEKHTRKAGRSIDKAAHSAARHLGFGFRSAKRSVQKVAPRKAPAVTKGSFAPAADC